MPVSCLVDTTAPGDLAGLPPVAPALPPCPHAASSPAAAVTVIPAIARRRSAGLIRIEPRRPLARAGRSVFAIISPPVCVTHPLNVDTPWIIAAFTCLKKISVCIGVHVLTPDSHDRLEGVIQGS
jgi:hypothetical protein